MRVVFLAAGAGGMFCGSCLRDNRLAANLIAEGKDVSIWPMYTPLLTDEKVVGSTRVHYSGLGVFLEEVAPIFRRPLGPIDRILRSNALLRLVGIFSSSTTPESLGPLTVSVLEGPDGHQRKELEDLVRDLKTLAPDVVNLPNLMFLGIARRLKEALGCRVVCTLSGEDIFLDRLPEPHRKRAFSLIEKAAVDVDAFVSVTEYFAEHAQRHFTLPPERMHVVPMGINVSAFSGATRTPQSPPVVGYFARICKEKGLEQLAESFIALRNDGHDLRLKIGGYLGRSDRRYFKDVMRRLRRGGVGTHVEHTPAPSFEDKVAFFRGIDVLCVPTLYQEAKGFYVLEALACGVPLVLPRHGSFVELVERTGGGVLYEPGNATQLQQALSTLLIDADARRELGERGREAVARWHSTEEMTQQTWALFENLTNTAPPSTVAP